MAIESPRCVAPLEYYARLGDASRYEVRRGARVEIGDGDALDGVPIFGWAGTHAQARSVADRLGLDVDWSSVWDAKAEENAGYVESLCVTELADAQAIVARVNDAETLLCGADATAERTAEGIVMPLCEAHAAEIDAESASN